MNEENEKAEAEETKGLINSGLLILTAIILGIAILTKFWLKSPVGSSWVSQVGFTCC